MGNELTMTKAGDTRQQILDTAKDIVLGKGFTAVGLNKILVCADVPKGWFYNYFKSKEQLDGALLKDYFDGYFNQLELTLKVKGSNISSRLLTFFQPWLDSQSSDHTADKCLVVKLSAKVTDLSETTRITLKNGTDRILERLTRFVAKGIAQGGFPAELDAKNVTAEIYYMWIGAILLTKVSRTRNALERAMHAPKSRLELN